MLKRRQCVYIENYLGGKTNIIWKPYWLRERRQWSFIILQIVLYWYRAGKYRLCNLEECCTRSLADETNKLCHRWILSDERFSYWWLVKKWVTKNCHSRVSSTRSWTTDWRKSTTNWYHHIVSELEFEKICACRVPHFLTNDLMRTRLEVGQQLYYSVLRKRRKSFFSTYCNRWWKLSVRSKL